MKKNITIGVLLVFCALSCLYAYVQQAEAVKQWKYAEANMQRAESAYQDALECKRTAEQLQKAMERALATTEAQKAIAEKILRETKK
jgi:uncharacterized Zn finger protein (UPF0148 family)